MRKIKKFIAGLMVTGLIVSTAFPAGQIRAAEEGVKIDETNFPDESFRGKASYYDADKNGYLSNDEIQKITDISYDGGENPSDRKVTSLKGIEHFTYLKTLHLYETQVTGIDLSQNKNLVKVSILNPLNTNTKELILPGNGKITELALSNYEAKTLDLSMLTGLKKIELKACTNLETIDLSKNRKLKSVEINAKDSTGKLKKSKLKTIIIGDKDNLKYLSGSNLSNLKLIKLGKTPILNSVYLTNNKKLKSINTVNMPKLRKLVVEGCGLKALNLSKNKNLTKLTCKNNKIKKLDIRKTKLKVKKVKCDKKVSIIK